MKRLALAAAGLLAASVALCQLSKYKDWPKSPEAYFLTDAEKQEFAKLTSDADAEKFIADYWTRRGGEPFKQEVSRRIAAADQQFKMRSQKGSESARGRVFITLGNPTRVAESRMPGSDSQAGGPGANPQAGTGAGSLQQQEEGPAAVIQTWTYDKSKFEPSSGLGEVRVQVSVDPARGRDELMNAGPVNKAIEKVNEMRLAAAQAKAATASGAAGAAPAGSTTGVAPATGTTAGAAPATGTTAGAAPATGAATSSAAPASAAPPAPPTAAIPAAARGILETAAKQPAEKSPDFYGGEFVTVTGEPFYAFQLIVPADKAPAGPVKLGGLVTKDDGTEASSIWEDVTPGDMKNGTKNDKSVDKSIVLPPGSYRGAFGVFSADGATAIASASTKFTISEKSGDFRVSPLVLAATLTPLTKRPNPTDPFVFGMEKPIRVEPKGNHLFSREDGLWYFYTVSNPAVPAAPAEAPAASATPSASSAPGSTTPAAAGAPGANAPPAAAAPAAPRPRIMTRIGVLRDGKPAFQPATLPAELQPLAPNYYASGSEIPLATFEPGYYTFTLQVRDLNAPKDSPAFKGIDRSGDFVVLTPEGAMPPTPTPAVKTTPTPRPRKKS